MIAPRDVITYADLQPRLFEGMAPCDVRTILSAASERRCPANSVVIHQGTPASEMFLLVKGRTRLTFTTPEGRKLILMWSVPGDVLGGMAFLSKPAAYLLSTEAVKQTTVLVWDRQTIRQFAACFPRMLENGLLIAANYVDVTLTRTVALSFHDAERRLGEIVMALARAHGRKVAGGIEIDVTNEELAGAAAITPFTTSRLISQWQRDRRLTKRRGKVLLRSSLA